ncbi:MAG: hypothetical protein F6J98_01950 [Moorea sp. SIO4G2]|nr:hypothetical protein [Moorena sp. SIO4G2]
MESLAKATAEATSGLCYKSDDLEKLLATPVIESPKLGDYEIIPGSLMVRCKVITFSVKDISSEDITQWVDAVETRSALATINRAYTDVHESKIYCQGYTKVKTPFSVKYDGMRRELTIPADMREFFNASFPPLDRVTEGTFDVRLAKDWLQDQETHEVIFAVKAEYNLPTHARLIAYSHGAFYVFRGLAYDFQSYVSQNARKYGGKTGKVQLVPADCDRPFPCRSSDRSVVDWVDVPNDYISVSTERVKSKESYQLAIANGQRPRHSPLKWAERKAYARDHYLTRLKKIAEKWPSMTLRTSDGIIWAAPDVKPLINPYGTDFRVQDPKAGLADLTEFLKETRIKIEAFTSYLETERAGKIISDQRSLYPSKIIYDLSNSEDLRADVKLCRDFLDYLTPSDDKVLSADKFSGSEEKRYMTTTELRDEVNKILVVYKIEISAYEINDYLRREGLQCRQKGIWSPTRKGLKYYLEERWDTGLIGWIANHYYLVKIKFLSVKIFNEKVKEANPSRGLTSHLIQEMLHLMGFQNREECRGQDGTTYTRWVPTDLAIEKKKVYVKGVRLLWHSSLVKEVSSQLLFLKKTPRRKDEKAFQSIKAKFTEITGVKATKSNAILLCDPGCLEGRHMRSVIDWEFAVSRIVNKDRSKNSSGRKEAVASLQVSEVLVWGTYESAESLARMAIRNGKHQAVINELSDKARFSPVERQKGLRVLNSIAVNCGLFGVSNF